MYPPYFNSIKFFIMKPLKVKLYRLTKNRSPLSFTIKVGRDGTLLYFDPEKGKNRAIRHCPNEPFIFMDRQSEFAVVEAIEFLNGDLVTGEKDVATQEFLACHPEYGVQFEEVNQEVEAENDIEMEERVSDLKQAVKEKAKEKNGIYELQALASILKGSIVQVASMGEAELKKEIYLAINENPNRFINGKGEIYIFTQELKKKHTVLMALDKEIIMVTPDKKRVVWGDNKDTIISLPLGATPMATLVEFLDSDDGFIVQQKILSVIAGGKKEDLVEESPEVLSDQSPDIAEEVVKKRRGPVPKHLR